MEREDSERRGWSSGARQQLIDAMLVCWRVPERAQGAAQAALHGTSHAAPPRRSPGLPACSTQCAGCDQLRSTPCSPCKSLRAENHPSSQPAALAMGIVSNVVVQGVVTFVILGSLKRAGVIK